MLLFAEVCLDFASNCLEKDVSSAQEMTNWDPRHIGGGSMGRQRY